jgi:hypothetical protein
MVNRFCKSLKVKAQNIPLYIVTSDTEKATAFFNKTNNYRRLYIPVMQLQLKLLQKPDFIFNERPGSTK